MNKSIALIAAVSLTACASGPTAGDVIRDVRSQLPASDKDCKRLLGWPDWSAEQQDDHWRVVVRGTVYFDGSVQWRYWPETGVLQPIGPYRVDLCEFVFDSHR